MKLKIGELLINERLITHEQLEEALTLQKAKKKRLGKVLVELGFVTENQIAQALSHQVNLPIVGFTSIDISSELQGIISQEDAQKYMVMPLRLDGKKLTIAMSDPLDYTALDELRFKTGYNLAPVVATERDIVSAIEKFYKVADKLYDIMKTVDSYENVEFLKEKVSDKAVSVESLYKLSEAPPIIKLVTMIIVGAVKARATDIHIEPHEESVVVRYRIDGDLRDELKLPKRVQDSVISRIKIISDLDITNRRLPQDGTSKLRLQDREVDLRISTLPTLYGEKIVIRLLDKSKGLVSLASIGFPENIQKVLIDILTQPQGFLLVTGPTGSGKSTTLYALLLQLKSSTENVVTVEDPVEYRVEDVTQVGVNESIGLTFASVLRSVLRQDPDIIMVGEIRDIETADIAIKSSLTGHFVLSSLHTNDTVSTITRLIDLGIPPFLVSSSLTGILAQRLVKRICPQCKIPDSLPTLPEGSVKCAFRGSGCDHCNNTGYRGQVGVFEFLPVTTTIRRMVAKGASEEDIRNDAKANGMRTLYEDALDKVEQGITTVEEVLIKIPNIG